jgi:hypothetical protein
MTTSRTMLPMSWPRPLVRLCRAARFVRCVPRPVGPLPLGLVDIAGDAAPTDPRLAPVDDALGASLVWPVPWGPARRASNACSLDGSGGAAGGRGSRPRWPSRWQPQCRPSRCGPLRCGPLRCGPARCRPPDRPRRNGFRRRPDRRRRTRTASSCPRRRANPRSPYGTPSRPPISTTTSSRTGPTATSPAHLSAPTRSTWLRTGPVHLRRHDRAAVLRAHRARPAGDMALPDQGRRRRRPRGAVW